MEGIELGLAAIVSRLLREARALAKLAHPNVIAIHDVGVVGDDAFVAMELVEGTTLKAWLQSSAPGRDEILDVFVQAGRGLVAAHSIGLVHRDFKPSNVILGRDGRVRVLDFGLARSVGPATGEDAGAPAQGRGAIDTITQTGAILGTPLYMAPEQLAGGELDARADQFSFCVALYEALYGERPFAGADMPELAAHIAAGERQPAPSGADVPEALHRALVRGLSARPEDRHPSMEVLLDELARTRRRPQRRGRLLAGVVAIASLAAVVAALLLLSPASGGGGSLRMQIVDDTSARMAKLSEGVAQDAEAHRLGVVPDLFTWNLPSRGRATEHYLRAARRADLESLRYLGVGLSVAQKEAVQETEDPLVITFATTGADAQAMLRRSAALMDCLGERLGGLIWDDEPRQLFAAAEWRTARLVGERGPSAFDQLAIHAYEQDGAVRMVSLGMAKLGLPDLVIQRATRSNGDDLKFILHLAAQAMIQRGVIEEAGKLPIDLTPPPLEDLARAMLDGGMPGQTTLDIARATPEDGDADNRLIELTFGAADDKEQVRQTATLDAFFGSRPDQVINTASDDAEMLAASSRARARLPDVRARFAKGLPPGDRLMVKARFEENGNSEWMWVEVLAWKGDLVTGILSNKPAQVSHVVQGARVTVNQDGLFDYVWHHADGTSDGGETNEVLERRSARITR